MKRIMIKWEKRVSGVYKRTPGSNTYAGTIKKKKIRNIHISIRGERNRDLDPD